MASKKILLKNERVWFHSYKKTSFIPHKDLNGTYGFREQNWTKGLILDEIVNETTRQISRAGDKTFADLSLTKVLDLTEWKKRKIVHEIKIKIDKNCDSLYEDAISFSIIQVKKAMFDQQLTGNFSGSFVSNTGNWSSNQLINSPKNNMFLNSIDFKDLNYDLPDDEDLVLVQQINFTDDNFKMAGSKKYAEATKPYVNYEITIVYSNGYM